MNALDDSLADLMVVMGTLPTEVHVPTSEIATAWAERFEELSFVSTLTPDIGGMFGYLDDHLEDVPLRLTDAAMSDAVMTDECMDRAKPRDLEKFFDAAAVFYTKKPWKICDEASLVIAPLVITDSTTGIVGLVDMMAGKKPGFLFFADPAAYAEHLRRLAEAQTSGSFAGIAPCLAVSFTALSAMPKAAVAVVRDRGWTLASRNAMPTLVMFGEDSAIEPTPANYKTAGFLLRALARLSTVKSKVRTALREDAFASWTLKVETPDGEEEFTITTPPSFSEKLREVLRLVEFDGDDPESHRRLAKELIRRFRQSPKANGVVVEYISLVASFAINYCGKAIIDITGEDLVEIVVDWMPKKAMLDPDDAYEIIAATRAFFSFLFQDYGVGLAELCMEISNDTLAAGMADALSTPSSFGMGKSIIAGGAAAGFDIDSEEGRRAWMQSIEDKPLPDSISLPGMPGVLGLPKAANPQQQLRLVRSPKTKATKNKQKAKRRARKKR